MTASPDFDQRLFAVQESRGGGPVAAIAAVSFLEAALDYAERHPADGAELRVIVVDRETGERHCFAIDLHIGVASSC